MDAIDRKLLGLLGVNARLPLKTLAGEVGLARSTVRERIDRLEASGVIRGYRADLAPEAGPTVSAILSLTLTRTPIPELVAALVAMPEVRRCYSLSGQVDLLVEAVCADTAALNSLRDAVSARPEVRSLTTALVLKRDKDS